MHLFLHGAPRRAAIAIRDALFLTFVFAIEVAPADAHSAVDELASSALEHGDTKKPAPKGKAAAQGRTDPASGWTVLESARDARRIHVSSSKGSDSNNGLGEDSPKKTLRAGLELMRDGHGDWLLLQKGDTWSADEGRPAITWIWSGRSAAEPAVLTSYGPKGARPRILTNGEGGISVQRGRGTPDALAHVAIVGIDFRAEKRDASRQNPAGALFRLPIEDLLVEDCRLTGFSNGITLQQRDGGRLANVRIRRNVISDCYAGDRSHAQGMYCTAVQGLLIEENVIDHGGWSATDAAAHAPDIFKHDIYVQGDCTDVIVRGNILSNASSHGVQLRSGGICNDNLFVRDSIAVLMGGASREGTGAQPSEIRRNVILDGKDITPELPRRQAIHLENIPNGVIVSENVIAHSEPVSRSRAISIMPLDSKDGGGSAGVRGVVIEKNVVYDWGGPALDIRDFAGAGAGFEGLVVRDNDFYNSVDADALIVHYCTSTPAQTKLERNRFTSTKASPAEWFRVVRDRLGIEAYFALVKDQGSSATPTTWVDPTRTLGTYNAKLGGKPTVEAFLEQALEQSRDTWKPEYTAAAVGEYVREGFRRKGS